MKMRLKEGFERDRKKMFEGFNSIYTACNRMPLSYEKNPQRKWDRYVIIGSILFLSTLVLKVSSKKKNNSKQYSCCRIRTAFITLRVLTESIPHTV